MDCRRPDPADICSRGVIPLCSSSNQSFTENRFPVQPEAHQDRNRQLSDAVKSGAVFQAPAERFISDNRV